VIPELDGKMHGISVRVPTPDASLTDVVSVLKRDVTVEEVDNAFKRASESGKLAKYIEYSEEPLVSSDIIGNNHSMVFDAGNTYVRGGSLVKILGWYDNEWGYSNRVCDLIEFIGEKM
ncbi:MAG: type I glyceraldehyde-3-phosphate dehydrogenase, partial [Proteobacteria bacterium]|nr:type I glyceraldehyde-3-phosphate dehydrogenase [Pseudomonadota bacterium]